MKTIGNALQIRQVFPVERVCRTQRKSDAVQAQRIVVAHAFEKGRLRTTGCEEILRMHLEPRDVGSLSQDVAMVGAPQPDSGGCRNRCGRGSPCGLQRSCLLRRQAAANEAFARAGWDVDPLRSVRCALRLAGARVAVCGAVVLAGLRDAVALLFAGLPSAGAACASIPAIARAPLMAVAMTALLRLIMSDTSMVEGLLGLARQADQQEHASCQVPKAIDISDIEKRARKVVRHMLWLATNGGGLWWVR